MSSQLTFPIQNPQPNWSMAGARISHAVTSRTSSPRRTSTKLSSSYWTPSTSTDIGRNHSTKATLSPSRSSSEPTLTHKSHSWRSPTTSTISNRKSWIRKFCVCHTRYYSPLKWNHLDVNIEWFHFLNFQGQKYAMYIVLPNQVDGLNNLLRTIDSPTLQRAKWLMDEIEVKVTLPRFKFENEVHLNEILQDVSSTATLSIEHFL